MSSEMFMRLTVKKALDGIRKGQAPFGACVVKDGKVISCEHNAVWKMKDCTAHAEIVALRKACEKLGTIDLSGCEVYSTCEPCPMCFSACHWAKISRICYGARIEDAKRFGFNELQISNEQMKGQANSKMKIEAGFMRDECMEIFKEWRKRQGRSY